MSSDNQTSAEKPVAVGRRLFLGAAAAIVGWSIVKPDPANAAGGALTFQGDWQPDTAYNEFDAVVHDGGFYAANATHTSGSDFDPSSWWQLSPQYGTFVVADEMAVYPPDDETSSFDWAVRRAQHGKAGGAGLKVGTARFADRADPMVGVGFYSVDESEIDFARQWEQDWDTSPNGPRIAEEYLQIVDPERPVRSIRPHYVKYDRTSHQVSEHIVVYGAGSTDTGSAGGLGFSVNFDDGSSPVGSTSFRIIPAEAELLTTGAVPDAGALFRLHASAGGNAALLLHSGQSGPDSAEHAVYANGDNILSFKVRDRDVMHLYRTGSGGAVSIGTANNRAALTVSQTAQPTNPALSVIAHPDATDDTLQVRDATGATHVRVTAATEKTSASVVVGHGVLPAGASDGFLYIPRIDGPPTGQPTEQPGTVPIAFDATNDSLWIYSDGWRSISAS